MEDHKLFFRILSDYLHGRASIIPEHMDLSEVIACAKRHNLEGIVSFQTKAPSLQKYYDATVFNFVKRKYTLARIEDEFRKNGIEYLIVKGFSIAALYPTPELRTMGDCDILIHTEDKEKAHEIMLNLGSHIKSQGIKESIYFLNKMEFELHDHLIYEDVRNSEKSVNFFDTVWEYTENDMLDWNFHFLFLLSHLRKHIMGEGVGIRQFMDLAVIINKVDLDWEKLTSDIEYLEMTVFFKRVLSLLNEWFDTKVPTFASSADTGFILNVTEKILDDGVFGFDNKENKLNRSILETNKKGKLYRILRRVFYPYSSLVLIPKYSFLKEKPYLLPYAWLLRIAEKWKMRKAIKERYFISISSERMNERIDYLSQWGL